MAIIVATAIYCGDTTDCSWGLEFLFFPLICALTSGPLVLYRALRRKGDPRWSGAGRPCPGRRARS